MNTNYECQDCGPFRPCDCTFECSMCLAVSVGQPNHPGGICPDGYDEPEWSQTFSTRDGGND